LECIKIQPNEGAAKYLYMGQLELGLQAVEYFKKGIEILISDLAKIQEDDNIVSTLIYLMTSLILQLKIRYA